MLKEIGIAAIVVEKRLRHLSELQVESLVASIADVGLLNPITVYERRSVASGPLIDGYGLVAGAHRLEACKRIGLVEIAANIVDLSDLERQIAECDENLCCAELSKSERALFTKRRKDAYEALHPETKRESFKGNQHACRQLGDNQIADRFTSDTAAKTGQSERAVQRDAERGEKISEQAIALIRGTKLDTGVELDKLKKVPPEKQVAWVEKRLQEPAPPKKAKVAADPLNDAMASERQVARLMDAWNAAGPEAREEFMLRIDSPVFDRSAVEREFGARG